MITWQDWAPPLDPPTEGGLDAGTAQAIADAVWECDPHLCAALQWEAYAATLPLAPAVASVSTGAQSVAYPAGQPAAGDYGMALARAAWHRSFLGTLHSAELRLQYPRPPVPPGAWWVVADEVIR